MKKFIYLLMMVAIVWLVKLSYDFYQVSQQVAEIQAALHKNEQKNANLNDQMVAMQRETDVSGLAQKKTQSNTITVEKTHTGLSPNIVIQQQLQLVQFALKQRQFVYALEQLTELDQNIENYELAETLKKSLHKAIAEDMQSIQQFVLAQNMQQEQLAEVLHQIDQSLQHALEQSQMNPEKVMPTHFWQKWFQVDYVDQKTPLVAQRYFILKETQFRVLLAQQALLRGQNSEYQAMLNLVIQQLDQLPDATSQQLKLKVLKLKQIQILPVPKLNSTVVLG